MSTKDLQIMIRHLLVAFAVIALLVAGPFLWADLARQPGSDAPTPRIVQLQPGPGLPSP